jgi:hypothetical protein
MKRIEVTGKHTGELSYDGRFANQLKIMAGMKGKSGTLSGNGEYIQMIMQSI